MGKRMQDHVRNHTKKQRPASTCPTRKVRHADKFSAMDAALSASLSYGHSMRTYECDKCNGWHLTSLDREWMSSAEYRRSLQSGESVAAEGEREESAGTLETPEG